MRRREFITLLGGAAAAGWPLAARAQQAGHLLQIIVWTGIYRGLSLPPWERVMGLA